MRENAYLKWLSSSTPTVYWHDSAVRAEQQEAFANGAVGMTTNPFLVQTTLNADRRFWEEGLSRLPADISGEEKAEALVQLVMGYYLDEVRPVFDRGVPGEGYVCAQTDPHHCGDGDYMVEQIKRYKAWGAPNLCIKVPATRAGIEAYEEGVAMGCNMVGTISVTVPQVIALAEAAERGKKRAREAGIEPGLTAAVLMAGRLDDYLRDCAHDSRADVRESDITQAGIACMKQAYQIFQDRGYSTWLMPAGLRGANQVREMAGAQMIFSIAPMIAALIDPDTPQETRIDVPVAPDVIERLMKLPEFRKAYLEDGMTTEQFITYGSNNRTIDQYINLGWNMLTGYQL